MKFMFWNIRGCGRSARRIYQKLLVKANSSAFGRVSRGILVGFEWE
jgi:hypothetical protein